MLLFLSSMGTLVGAFQNGQSASTVMGQSNFNSGSHGLSQSTFSIPYNVAFDSSGNLWVADASNGRVLEFVPPLTNGEKASIVLGQVNFTAYSCGAGQSAMCTSYGLAFDSSGNLWVSDPGGDRVLQFSPPFTSNEKASIVIGQPNFISSGYSAATAASLNNPRGIAIDSSGNLWVADFGFNRVLKYAPPFSNNESASVVLGQRNSTGNFTSTTRWGLNNPNGITFDSSGSLWVADAGNNRVLRFDSPFSVGENASVVLGQRSYTSSYSSSLANQSNLNTPYGVAFDSGGNLWVADRINNRVLEFTPSFSNGKNATVVLGQSGFQSSAAATTASGLSSPDGLAADKSGNMWVADTENNRVLEFLQSASLTTSSSSTSTLTGGGSSSSTSLIISSSVTQTSNSTTTSTAASSSSTVQTPTSAGTFPVTLAVAAVVILVVIGLAVLLLRRRGR
jgi:sugar lactone lactonase YvrE